MKIGTIKKQLFVIINASILSSGLALVSVANATTEEARQRLESYFTTVSSIQGNFNQEVFSKKGELIQTSTGNISMLRPGKFRWVYKTPDPQTIVSDGENIWIHDEDLEQVTIKPISEALSSAPIAVLMRKQKPDEQFRVDALPNNKEASLDWFKLTPHKNSKDFKSFEVGFDKNTLRQMVMHDQLGQKTILKLDTRLNQPIQGNTFYFEIPEGADVIGSIQ